jgi:hypothetical protein
MLWVGLEKNSISLDRSMSIRGFRLPFIHARWDDFNIDILQVEDLPGYGWGAYVKGVPLHDPTQMTDALWKFVNHCIFQLSSAVFDDGGNCPHAFVPSSLQLAVAMNTSFGDAESIGTFETVSPGAPTFLALCEELNAFLTFQVKLERSAFFSAEDAASSVPPETSEFWTPRAFFHLHALYGLTLHTQATSLLNSVACALQLELKLATRLADPARASRAIFLV